MHPGDVNSRRQSWHDLGAEDERERDLSRSEATTQTEPHSQLSQSHWDFISITRADETQRVGFMQTKLTRDQYLN